MRDCPEIENERSLSTYVHTSIHPSIHSCMRTQMHARTYSQTDLHTQIPTPIHACTNAHTHKQTYTSTHGARHAFLVHMGRVCPCSHQCSSVSRSQTRNCSVHSWKVSIQFCVVVMKTHRSTYQMQTQL